MKKTFLVAIASCLYICIANADTYKVTDGKIYYQNDSLEEVCCAMLLGSIPNENVYIRMSDRCKTFTLYNTRTKEYFLREAPTKWPGIKLKDCIRAQEPNIQHIAKNRSTKGDLKTDPKRGAQFHYLCVFANEYDDPKWNSFDDDEHIVTNMEHALKTLADKQQRMAGEQYIISPQNATRENIVTRLDTIFRQTKEDDIVFIYLSSHGEYDLNGNFHFIVKDSHFDQSNKRIENSLSKDDINFYINLLTDKNVDVLLFVDACNAGDLAYNDDVNGNAAYYLSTQKKSNAYTDVQGSLFAHALMDVMNGNSIQNNHFNKGYVCVGSLGSYLEYVVFKNSDQKQQPKSEFHDFGIGELLWKNTKNHESKEVLRNKDIINDKENCSPSERASAMIAIGDSYFWGKDINGENTLKSLDSAFLWYSKAERLKGISKKICAHARYGLYHCYREDNKDRKAIEYLQEASKDYAQAKYELGLCYIDGYGVKKKYKDAIKLIKQSAKGKDACSDAQWYLGFLYHQRAIAAFYDTYTLEAVLRNENKRIPFDDTFKKAFCYSEILGEGFEVVYNKHGKKTYITAVSGSSYSEYMKESVNWYEKSADNGNAQAQYDLGKLYYDGLFVKKDSKKGLDLIQEAAHNDCKDAITFLKKIDAKNEKK